MADISKCMGEDCSLKEKCYRYTADDGDWQSYLSYTPYEKSKNECELFWENNS